jgi:repressor LexA
MLTEKQQDFFDYLKRRLREQGDFPSLRQAAKELGISHSAVAQLLAQLEKKGVVERQGRYSRSLRLLPDKGSRPQPSLGREVPIIGRVTAGLPMYAQQEWDGSVVVDAALFRGDNLFCLRVSGDSMRDAGIFDRDMVICEPRQYAENGEIVAVLIHHEEATVKRFFLRSACIELRPENADYPVMRYGFGEVLIQGKVIGVVRATHPSFSGADA